MYSKNDTLRVLRKNLDSELDVIKFYIDNKHKLNYGANKRKIDSLVADSFTHATLISQRMLDLGKGIGYMDNKTRQRAYKEETAVKEIYRYELNRTLDKESAKLLKRLIKEETKHERIVGSLK